MEALQLQRCAKNTKIVVSEIDLERTRGVQSVRVFAFSFKFRSRSNAHLSSDQTCDCREVSHEIWSSVDVCSLSKLVPYGAHGVTFRGLNGARVLRCNCSLRFVLSMCVVVQSAL